jgi:hypothetical protein
MWAEFVFGIAKSSSRHHRSWFARRPEAGVDFLGDFALKGKALPTAALADVE